MSCHTDSFETALMLKIRHINLSTMLNPLTAVEKSLHAEFRHHYTDHTSSQASGNLPWLSPKRTAFKVLFWTRVTVKKNVYNFQLENNFYIKINISIFLNKSLTPKDNVVQKNRALTNKLILGSKKCSSYIETDRSIDLDIYIYLEFGWNISPYTSRNNPASN